MIEALNLFAGININKVFDLSYAFEWSFSRLRNYNSGTHELIIGLRLNHGKNITYPSKYW